MGLTDFFNSEYSVNSTSDFPEKDKIRFFTTPIGKSTFVLLNYTPQPVEVPPFNDGDKVGTKYLVPAYFLVVRDSNGNKVEAADSGIGKSVKYGRNGETNISWLLLNRTQMNQLFSLITMSKDDPEYVNIVYTPDCKEVYPINLTRIGNREFQVLPARITANEQLMQSLSEIDFNMLDEQHKTAVEVYDVTLGMRRGERQQSDSNLYAGTPFDDSAPNKNPNTKQDAEEDVW